MARLQILINHYKEDRDTVMRFLSSLDKQGYRDFSVMVLGDGGVRLSEEDLSGFSFPLEYAYKQHTGVCDTRNVMLDRATAEFVMLCDADDYFSADGLGLLMAKSDSMDIVGSTYLAEGPHGETKRVERDVIRFHGKVFRRQYLVDNDIRFPDLEFSGDMAFLWLAYALTDRIAWVDDVFYTWAWNPNSVTRADPYFKASHYGNTLACYTWLAHDLIKRDRSDLLNSLVATLFAMMYIDATSVVWKSYPKDLRALAESHMSECITEFMPVYEMLSEGYVYDRYQMMRRYAGLDCGAFPDMMPWLESMVEKSDGVLIVGHGVVGTNLGAELGVLNPSFCDKYKGEVAKGHFRFAFICVDTPYTEDDPCDITEVENALRENEADIYVIKSTVLPGTTRQLSKLTGKRIVFSPEYYGSTQHANGRDSRYVYDFTILGGDKNDCIEVVQLLQDVYDGSHQFKIIDSTTAELAKYMENCWIATKVSFCNQFAQIAEQYGVYYEELRELFLLDPRVSPSHTYSYRSHPFWSSHCLNKDVPAIAKHANAPLLDSIIAFNEQCKTGQ